LAAKIPRQRILVEQYQFLRRNRLAVVSITPPPARPPGPRTYTSQRVADRSAVDLFPPCWPTTDIDTDFSSGLNVDDGGYCGTPTPRGHFRSINAFSLSSLSFTGGCLAVTHLPNLFIWVCAGQKYSNWATRDLQAIYLDRVRSKID
jgi:hypothetical protein